MSYSQNMRDELARKREGRGGKLARVFARPEQVVRDDKGNIIINPRGETTLQRAQREAKEARRAADEAKRSLPGS
jgi:hypothetical protein